MKRWILTLLLSVLVASASVSVAGCRWIRIPVERRGLVSLVAFDEDPSERGYAMSIAVLNPLGLTTAGQKSGPAQVTPVIVRRATAASPEAAVRFMSSYTYLNFDMAHVQGVFFSEALARKGVAPIMDYLTRSGEFGGLEYWAVTRGIKAGDLIQDVKVILPNPGQVWLQTTEWSRIHTPFIAQRMDDMLERMDTPGHQPVTAGVQLPSQSLVDGLSQGTLQALQLRDLAVFNGDRLVGWMDPDESYGWMFLTGHAIHQPLTFSVGGRTVAMEILGGSTHIRVTGPGPDFLVQVRVSAMLSNVAGPANFGSGSDPFVRYEKTASERVSGYVWKAIRKARALGVDPFGFGEQLRIQKPALWTSLRAEWGTRGFREAGISVTTSVRIQSPGATLGGMS